MNQNEPQQRPEGEIYPPEFIIESMRDSGYRNTAYALAELIDNSVQAKAKNIEVTCIEESKQINKRERSRLKSICVIDDGEGMTPDILRQALQFGKGTHLRDRNGIGRFGMGLPNSSISQCRRVEVWTWQNGHTNAVYSYLDVDEIKNGDLTVVPEPFLKSLPEELINQSGIINTAGTLVLWTKLDEHKITWRTARSTLENIESLIGRMYRKYINNGKLSIRLLSITNGERVLDRFVRVNDPLYLMEDSLTPEPFNKEPMFQKWGEADEEFTFSVDGTGHKVIVRMSWADPKTVPSDGMDRGSKPYGKHAAKNLGVSIVRHGRELKMDSSWTSNYDPTDRWWGVEVEFPPALDEFFGVTNNKQDAIIFSQMSHYDWESEAEPDESEHAFVERMSGEADPKIKLWPIAKHIKRQIRGIKKKLKDQTKGRRLGGDRHKPGPEDKATTKFNQRAKGGHRTDYDDESFTETDGKNLVDDLVVDKGYSSRTAREIADTVVERHWRVIFLEKSMEGYSFFNVEQKHGGITEVVFNTNHPFHEQLIESLETKIDNESHPDLASRLEKASDTIRILFSAWARYEMEEMSQQDKLSEMRQEWGKMARFFLKETE